MRGLDPRIHLFAKKDELPGLAALRRPGNDGALLDIPFAAVDAG
jgi:hypothetical protein